MRRLTVLPAILCLLVAGHASAGEMLDEAVRSLRVDPVYVHPQADPTLDPEAAQRLRDRISVSAAPVFIAVLPSWAADEAGGVDELPRAIGVALDRTGAVAVISGRSFRAGASAGVGLDGGQAGQLATQSFEAFHPTEHGLEPMLADFVGRVEAAGAGPAPAPVAPPDVVRHVPDAGLEPMPWRSVPDPSPFPGFGLILVLMMIVGVGGAIAKAIGSSEGWSRGPWFSSSLTPLDDDDHHHRRRTGWPFGSSSSGGSIFSSSASSRSGDWGSSSRGGSGDWGGSSGGSSSGGSSSGGSSKSGGGDW